MFRTLSTRRMFTGVIFSCVLGLAVSGCATNAQTSSLVGAGLGAAIGNWIGDDTEGTLWGAGIGAAAGLLFAGEEDEADMADDVAVLPDEED